jgi:hypothetical protein
MNLLKILVIAMIFGGIAIFGSEMGEQLAVPGAQELVPVAEARVGRPLTPVSVAGVARRTVRRCAVGVYCSLPGSESSANLLGKRSAVLTKIEKHRTDPVGYLEGV